VSLAPDILFTNHVGKTCDIFFEDAVNLYYPFIVSYYLMLCKKCTR